MISAANKGNYEDSGGNPSVALQSSREIRQIRLDRDDADERLIQNDRVKQNQQSSLEFVGLIEAVPAGDGMATEAAPRFSLPLRKELALRTVNPGGDDAGPGFERYLRFWSAETLSLKKTTEEAAFRTHDVGEGRERLDQGFPAG